jgi:hypothetical protein
LSTWNVKNESNIKFSNFKHSFTKLTKIVNEIKTKLDKQEEIKNKIKSERKQLNNF